MDLGKARALLASDFRFLKVILSVVVFSEIYWIPYLIFKGIEIITEYKHFDDVSWIYVEILYYLNSAVNFFIYASRDKDFYNAYKLLLSCRL